MPRFVVANRRAGKFDDAGKVAARVAMDRAVASVASAISIVGDNEPPSELERRVLVIDADAQDISALAAPDILVEPEIEHWPARLPLAEFAQAGEQMLRAPVGNGDGKLTVHVRGSGQPLLGASVRLFLRAPGGTQRELAAITKARGRVTFSFPGMFDMSNVLVSPAGNFWDTVVRAPRNPVTVECPPLPETGPLGWWHHALGQSEVSPTAGSGIRVGVADTGFGPHPALNHVVDAGAFVDGTILPSPAGRDVESHGSHVCGIIGARSTGRRYAGFAPGCSLFSARVFAPGRSANQGDIANAIDNLSRAHQVDLINLSLTAAQGSTIAHDAIQDAAERGTLIVCAAGNTNGGVLFPAQFKECIAVSALGRAATAPAGTLSATRLPTEPNRFGADHLYLANFSCFGDRLDCAGAGVAVISAVPERFTLREPYGVMDGTSMASPSVCGALAVLLSQSDEYKSLRRDEVRTAYARRLLLKSCRDVDMAAAFVGRGVPTVRS